MGKEYTRGYYAGSRKAWPSNRPPEPPNVIVCKLLVSAMKLRDEADSICASLSEDDDFVKRLGPAIDAVDQSMMEITKWLRESAIEATP